MSQAPQWLHEADALRAAGADATSLRAAVRCKYVRARNIILGHSRLRSSEMSKLDPSWAQSLLSVLHPKDVRRKHVPRPG